MLSYSSLPEPPTYSIDSSPFRPRRRFEHERPGSEVMQRTRPIMASTPHRKTASIYVSEASIVLSKRSSVCSPIKSDESLLSLSPTDIEPQDFVDHYAILEVKVDATSTEIREAFRGLRKTYFQTDATKYRALQTAFDTLLDPEARQAYDSVYCARALNALAEQSKHGRKDSALSNNAKITTVQEEEEEQQEIDAATRQEIEDARQREIEDARRQDPNWGLKHHTKVYEPLIGTQPYHSFIPILQAYEGRDTHPVLKCNRTRYSGHFATNSKPN